MNRCLALRQDFSFPLLQQIQDLIPRIPKEGFQSLSLQRSVIAGSLSKTRVPEPLEPYNGYAFGQVKCYESEAQT